VKERSLTRQLREATLATLERFTGLLGVRQIWYRLISPPFQLLPQTQNSYKGFDRLMVKWRETGVIPPGRIADRSTAPSGGEHGDDSVRGFLRNLLEYTTADSYVKNHWSSQETAPIIYIEKDTLTEQIHEAVEDLGVVIYPTKGVVSFTKLWKLAQRRRIHVLYLTDHDATGVFMDGDFRSRLTKYGGVSVPVTRIALTTDQVRQFNLPPNPVHPRDSRSPEYVKRFGNRAWELDALPPDELGKLVRKEVERFIDRKAWAAVDRAEAVERAALRPLLQPLRSLLEEMVDGAD
jgi:hypothetical protein